jgi:hypothetical protein
LIRILAILLYSLSAAITNGGNSEQFSLPADTLPMPPDTIPSIPDTIPVPPDTIPVLPDTIPVEADTADADTIPQQPGFPGMEPFDPEEERKRS